MSERHRTFSETLVAVRRALKRTAVELKNPAAGARINYKDSVAPEFLYARGFILCKPGCAPATVAGWRRWVAGKWELRVDPRVPVDHAEVGEREIWIIGDAFHVGSSVFKNVARWALEGDLLANLDDLAGRYLLVSRTKGKLEVFHDAMGSRSVFYGEGVVASHSALAAEVTGAGLRPWILPFITSRGYIKRDVKYLPGLESPFSGISQLTPNTSLDVSEGKVRRYWPRSSIAQTTPEQALDALVEHLRALGRYFDASGLRPIIGLSAGRDSRGVLAALDRQHPRIFTFVRSSSDSAGNPADTRAARALAEVAGLDLEVIRLDSPPSLDAASSPFAVTFRHNTGYVRGNGSGWVEHYAGSSAENELFVRGFGGEVMRGFYPKVAAATPKSLANLYDVNAGSNMTREAFGNFMQVSGWGGLDGTGYQPHEALYWEHRMGIWGSSALAESDMAFRSIPGYNSRQLFEFFLGLPAAVDRRNIFETAIMSMEPALAVIPYSS